MIIRLSQQMMKKVKVSVPASLEPAPNPLCDWAVHLYRSRRLQYLLATNTTSLFSVTFSGRGITDQEVLQSRLFPALHQLHSDAGLEETFERFIAPCVGQVAWSKAGNRSVTGSMNELIYQAQWIMEERALSSLELSQELNQSLFSFIQYQRPLEAHRQLASRALSCP